MADLFDTLEYWIRERESIRKKREKREKRPWTTDPILIKYRFCNVKRMDDRVSRWLTDNWYTPYQNSPNFAFACSVARQINWPETLEEITPFVFGKWEPARIKKILERRKYSGQKVYTGAYMLTGTLGGTKIQQTIDKILTPIRRDPPTIHWDSMEKTHAEYMPRAGYSSFIAGQVVADMVSSGFLEAADALTWAPLGPGSKRGLNRLHGRPLESGISKKQAVEEMVEVYDEMFARAPEIFEDRKLILMDLQNCLCEFDKYVRVTNGEGRPRSIFVETVE